MELPRYGSDEFAECGSAGGYVPGPPLLPKGVTQDGEITAPGTVHLDENIVVPATEEMAVHADTDWHIEAMMPAVMEPPIAHDIVAAPTAEELAARNMLDVADDPTRIAYLHGQLPHIKERLVSPLDPDELPRYDLCQMDYWSAHEEAGNAVLLLNRVMAGHTYDQGPRLLEIQQKFTGQYLLEDATLMPATTYVRMYFGEEGLTNPLGTTAIQTYTYTRQPDAPIIGGVVSAPDGRLPKDRKISAEYLQLPPLGPLAERMAHNIRYHAWGKGVEPWVEEYMTLPQPAEQPSSESFGGVSLSLGVYGLMVGGEQSPEQALATLRFAFGGGHIGTALQNLQQTDPEALAKALAQYGATDRFAWFVDHAEAIHASVVEAEKQALEDHFRDRFVAWRDRVVATASEVNALAEELERLGGQSYETIAARYNELEPRTHFPLGGAWPGSDARPRALWLERLRMLRARRNRDDS
jgi:hypothetical protein